MTYRSRAGGPLHTHRKNKLKPGQPRKLHHPPSAAQRVETEASSVQAALTEPTEEAILDTLRSALSSTLSSPDFRSTIQKIKGLLYDSKWLEVFTDETLLEAYAGRWVPSRALCFRELMVYLKEVREFVLGAEPEGSDSESEDEEETDEGLRIVSLGGGAGSELLAVASLLAYHKARIGRERACEWIGADIGKWGSVLDKVDAAAQDSFSISALSVQYTETDLLLPATPLLSQLDPASPTLITLFFTLTELLTQSPSSTISLLRAITDRTAPGSLFLIADSASDIASFSLGSERKWPTYTIADLVLLKMMRKGEGEPAKWKLVEGEDSRWFRMGEGLVGSWPVKLENVRYWYRLYRRV